MRKIATFLMFEGRAEEAMNFYSAVFEEAEIVSITRYGPNEDGTEGSVMQARFSISGQAPLSAFTGQDFMFFDSSIEHEFTFTPAMSLFVNCETEDEIDRIFDQLSLDGQVLMPLDVYPFSQKYAWVSDQFGVSWQLNLIGDED